MAVHRTPRARDTLLAFLSVSKKADQEIIFELERAQADTQLLIRKLRKSAKFSDRVRAEQLKAARRAMHVRLKELYEQVGVITLAKRSEVIIRTTEIGIDYDAVFAERHLTERELQMRRRGLLDSAVEQVERFMLRHRYTHMPLSRQVYRTTALANGWVDRIISNNIARGSSVEEFARDIERFINPRTPGGARYAALRLARTELNNAAHAAAVWHAQQSEYVSGMRWHTSDSHPTPDECDTLGGQTFKPTEVPRKPHPQCLCYVTPETMSEDDFINSFLASEGL